MINTIDKSIATLTKEKKETQINKIINQRGYNLYHRYTKDQRIVLSWGKGWGEEQLYMIATLD